MKVPVVVVTTDQDARIIFAESVKDAWDAGLHDAVMDLIRWGGACKLQIRQSEIEVPLLPAEPLEALTLGPTGEDITPPDLRKAFEDARAERLRRNVDMAWNALMQSMPPGRYEVHRETNSYGIRKLEE